MHTKTKNTVSVCLTIFCAALVTCFILRDGQVTNAQQMMMETSLIRLETTDILSESSKFRAFAISPSDEKTLYGLEPTGDLVAQSLESKASQRTSNFIQSADALAINGKNFYTADSSNDAVKITDSKGKVLKSINLPDPTSLSVLKNNNLLIASATKGKLLHLYNSQGNLVKSFGELKNFDADNPAQNQFLNRGKVAVTTSNEVYYVPTFAPEPVVQKFSSDGKLLAEFAVEGEAVNFQSKYQRSFLDSKEPLMIGGFRVISSIAVDAATNHVFVAMNGVSKRREVTAGSGVVYEYDSNGRKLREYALVISPDSDAREVIINVKDIQVKAPWIYVLTAQGDVYRFNFNDGRFFDKARQNSKSRSFLKMFLPASWTQNSAPEEETCPQAQPTFNCIANCPEGAPSATVDCGAVIRARMGSNDRLIRSSCNTFPTGCSANVIVCDTTNGNNITLSTELECPEPTPPPPPSGNEGYGGTGWCDIDVPPSCSDWVDNDGDWDIDMNDSGCVCPSPIVIDTLGNGFNLTNTANGVMFDIAGTGNPIRLSWIRDDEAWLALDRNNNGTIDSGKELFGNYTPQPPVNRPHGFLALAEYDKAANGGNGDGLIDNRDSIFSSLRLWKDANRNGISEAAELHPLLSLGVAKLELDWRDSKRTDEHGNRFRYRAKVRDVHGAQVGRWAWDVILVK